VRRQEATVKVEPNLVIRGSVFPSTTRVLSPRAADLFKMSVECRVLSEEELYAGKICAALDRQHPRDLIGIEGVEDLPAVKWKLLNIGRMNPSKHKQAVRKLRDYLGV